MREKNMDCDAAFDEWYAGQRHQLANEELCRLIWREGWMGAESEWRGPLQDCEIAMVATYAPEGVTDDDVAVIVRKVEQMHGLRHNALAQADAACGVSPGAMGSAAHLKRRN